MNSPRNTVSIAWQLTGLLVVAMTALWTTMAHGQSTQPSTAGRHDQPVLQDAPSNIRTVELVVGQARTVEAPWPVKRVSISDSKVADVDVNTPRRIQIVGKSVGTTSVTIYNDAGDNWQARLDVRADVTRLQDQLRRLFDNKTLELSQAEEIVMIKGTFARSEDVAQMRQFLQMANIKYLDRSTVAGLQQVQLQVKVAEVSRTAIRMLGINAYYGGNKFFGGLQLGSSTGPFTPMNVGLPSGTPVGTPNYQTLGDVGVPQSATLFGGFPNSDLQLFLQALSENQYLRIMAEPTLVARSGQEANFLAGGEFPIPIAQLGSGGTTQISIEYKEFGVRLHFTPTVMGNGMIQLRVQPEVSQLSDVGAVSVLGTRVPSVLTRRVETTLELQTGQTFAIAGLINQTDSARTSYIPLLGELPIIGSLFQSVRYSRDDTEMMVLVTASLVEPTSTDLNPAVPGSFHDVPNDWELYVNGRIEGRTKARLAPAQQDRLKRMGLDGLRGPGAWASYDNMPDALAGQNSKSK